MVELRQEHASSCCLTKAAWAKSPSWAGLTSIVNLSSEVHEKSTGKITTETRWYISSLNLNAEKTLHAVRSHWQWVLDMTIREDEYHIRKKTRAGLNDDYRSPLLESGIKMR
ncbi:MAG: hypothetical protein GY928_39930 [Colwellia sp.]|nr:hypothetical protein [Colwellia sp.]